MPPANRRLCEDNRGERNPSESEKERKSEGGKRERQRVWWEMTPIKMTDIRTSTPSHSASTRALQQQQQLAHTVTSVTIQQIFFLFTEDSRTILTEKSMNDPQKKPAGRTRIKKVTKHRLKSPHWITLKKTLGGREARKDGNEEED